MSRQSDQLIYEEATEYRGFHIDNRNSVFKNGKRVFSDCRFYAIFNKQDAKAIIDMSVDYVPPVYVPRNYVPDDREELENGIEEQQRFEERVNEYYEQQLNDL